jgi:hypothetical protein
MACSVWLVKASSGRSNTQDIMILHRIIRYEECGLRCELCANCTEAIHQLRLFSYTMTDIAGSDSYVVRGLPGQ